MAAFKLSDWNDILRRINTLSANPPEGYSELAPLALVTDPHQWSVADITTVRTRLQAICSTNSFSAPLTLWSQAIIDEINAAIRNGWCGLVEMAIYYHPGPVAYTFLSYPATAYHLEMRPNPYVQAGGTPQSHLYGDFVPLTVVSIGSLPAGGFTTTLDVWEIDWHQYGQPMPPDRPPDETVLVQWISF
jgi:hypothetical protein